MHRWISPPLSFSFSLKERANALLLPRPGTERHGPTAAGFTLIEVLVSITIIAMLLSTIYTVFSSVGAAKERLDESSEAYHRARIIFDRLSREIRGAALPTSARAAHFRGGEQDNGFFFFELNTTAVSPAGNEAVGLALVRYTLEKDQQAHDGDNVLMRSEEALLGRGDYQERPSALRLAPGIRFVKMRFYAAGTWHDKWDAAAGGLPDLVEVSLRLADHTPEGVPFLTTIELPGRETAP